MLDRRNVFVTFLGTGKYHECSYRLGRQVVENVRFVQEVLVRLLCRDFGPADRILVFLTKKAKDENWEQGKAQDGTIYDGLRPRLKAMGKGELVRDVPIPNGASQAELWEVFTTVFDRLEEGDRVIFDVTHGFRSLPMLGVVLLNYARLLKRINIAGIYYGAFDAKGEDGVAPIFDLTDFATLLEWTSAVQEFVHHGNPAGIAELLKQAAVPRLSASAGHDAAARTWRETADRLKDVAGQIMTNRGAEIVEGRTFAHVRQNLARCRAVLDLPEPFRPLIDSIEEKTEPFRENDPANCLAAVRWCLDHNLVQQGLTMLQEGLITMIAKRVNLNESKRSDRELISDVVNKYGREKIIPPDVERSRKTDAEKVLADSLVRAIMPTFLRLSDARNDINHGGFCQPKKAESLRGDLRKCLEQVAAVWNGNVADGVFRS